MSELNHQGDMIFECFDLRQKVAMCIQLELIVIQL